MENTTEMIWQEFSTKLLSFINRKVNNQSDAEDILQEVFLKIYTKLDTLDDQKKVSSWLYRITQNTIIDYYRKQKEVPLNDLQLMGNEQSTEELINMNEEIIECLKVMMSDLPDKYKESLEEYEFQGLKHIDISKKHKITLSGSKTRVQRGRKKLKAIIQECCELEVDKYGNILAYKENEHDCNKKYRCKKKYKIDQNLRP